MKTIGTRSKPSKSRLPGRVFNLIMADQVLSQSSYFALLPVLPLLLTLKFGSTQERLIAGSVSVLTLMTRGGALFLASPLHRLSVRSCVRIALTLISVSYAVVALAANPYAIIAALGAAGLGFSVNGTGVRSFIALATPDRASQNRGFAVIQVVANCTAAVGPILGNMILDRNIYEQFLLGVSVALFIAAILAPMAAPKGVMMSEGSLRPPMGIKIFRELFRTADARKITIIALIGSILIGQFFSSFSLVFSAIATSSMMRSLFYTTNGVLVVLIQIPISLLVERQLKIGVKVQKIMMSGVYTLGISMLFFNASKGLLGVVLVFCGVFIFSLGETVFAPILNVAFANLTEGRPVVESMNMRQLTSAVGETVGVWIGLSVYSQLEHAHLGLMYWIALTALAALSLRCK